MQELENRRMHEIAYVRLLFTRSELSTTRSFISDNQWIDFCSLRIILELEIT